MYIKWGKIFSSSEGRNVPLRFRRYRSDSQLEDLRLIGYELKGMGIGKGIASQGKGLEHIPGDWMWGEREVWFGVRERGVR